ncbi:MAG TPA: fused MFS/spermidine synthase [Steroidobacteraceae bacterium]
MAEVEAGEVIYALTVIVAASLLFLVQPLIAKLILPWFGGSSAVWSAALMFFQACVFGGYVYAHVVARFSPKLQAGLHTALLVAGVLLMPIIPDPGWKPTGEEEPTLRIVLLLSATVGLPCLLLSATSPLLQVWYMRRTGSQLPYWLYSLSNLGSLVALLGFPLLLEPLFDTSTLAIAWSIAFGVFALLSVVTGWLSSRGEEITVQTISDAVPPPPSATQVALWLLFAACGSALLVAVSAHLTVNVAPIPLLWVVPLALYLLTFILTFGSRRFYERAKFFPWLATALGCMTYLYMKVDLNLHIRYAIPLYLVSLFVICMACHGELVHRRPHPRYLTRFYLFIALGGVLGGAFVALLAPLLFDSYWELPIVLIVTAVLAVVVQWKRMGNGIRLWIVRGTMVAGLLAMGAFLVLTEISFREGYLFVDRNFYGVLRVRDYDVGDQLERRVLFHGTISHGSQYRSEVYRDVVGSYYSSNSGIARAIYALQARGRLQLGVVGLGAGVMASYARPGDAITLYEIDPGVVRVAHEYFDFVSRAKERGAAVEIVLGDARLSLERQTPKEFDLLAVDAFSSDAIPVHLLTLEAIETYLRHLKPDGVLAIHISNRYLNLAPVCARAAEHFGRTAFLIDEPSNLLAHASTWVLIVPDTAVLQHVEFDGAQVEALSAPQSFRAWTDSYSNIWSVLKLRSR